MVRITKKNSSTLDKLKRRIVKVLALGRSSVYEAFESAPHGVDANAPNKKNAVYAESLSNNTKVILGYINDSQKAEVGGFRIYSTNESGEEQNDIYLRANGDIEIGGNTDNAVKWNRLNSSMNQLQAKVNTNLYLIASGIAAAGGAYTPQLLSVSFNSSKSDKVKLS